MKVKINESDREKLLAKYIAILVAQGYRGF
jgi:hypothetical protein